MADYIESLTYRKFLARIQERRVAGNSSETNPASDSWDRDAGWSGAQDMLARGWPEGISRAMAMARPIMGKLGGMLRREDFYPAFEGPVLDVATYCQGIPECWLAMEQTDVEAPGRLLRVVVNTWISGSQPADQIETRGAAVLAFVLLAEQAGFSVAVDMVLRVKSRSETGSIETRLRLKEYGDAMDADRLAYAMIHPAFFRRLWFRWIENLPCATDHGVTGGYGGYGPAEVSDRGDVYLSEMYGSEPCFASPEAAGHWVHERLAEQGVIAPPPPLEAKPEPEYQPPPPPRRGGRRRRY